MRELDDENLRFWNGIEKEGGSNRIQRNNILKINVTYNFASKKMY